MKKFDRASDFQVSEKLASTLVKNRVILVGDAARIHSPAGGQGPNAGIQDGHTLGTALARGAEKKGEMHSELENYATRRYAAAQSAIATTQQQLRILTAQNRVQKSIRNLGIAALSAIPKIQRKALSKTAQQDALQLAHSELHHSTD